MDIFMMRFSTADMAPARELSIHAASEQNEIVTLFQCISFCFFMCALSNQFVFIPCHGLFLLFCFPSFPAKSPTIRASPVPCCEMRKVEILQVKFT